MKRLFLALIFIFFHSLGFSQQWVTNGTNIYNNNSGNVGIGITIPQSKLHLRHTDLHGGLILDKNSTLNAKSQISFRQANSEIYAIGIDQNANNTKDFFIYSATQGVIFYVFPDGKAKIGATAPITGPHSNFKLAVDGKLVTKNLVITAVNWADYVFNPDYDLISIDSLKHYIGDNGHLPGMLKESELKDNGVDVMTILSQQQAKIEELTLYIILLMIK